MWGHSFLFSSRSDSYLNLWIYGQNSTNSWKTTRYDDGQSPRNKASKIKKVSVSLFYADISKSEEISKWSQIDKTLHYNFSATKTFFFFKSPQFFYQKDWCSFQQWVQKEVKRSILQDYEETDTAQTHTHKPQCMYQTSKGYTCTECNVSHLYPGQKLWSVASSW